MREELTAAMADGRGVTAKVRWIPKANEEGRNRWIHCTPLIGSNGAVGVWMVVIVDDEIAAPTSRKWRPAPPVQSSKGQTSARAGPEATKSRARSRNGSDAGMGMHATSSAFRQSARVPGARGPGHGARTGMNGHDTLSGSFRSDGSGSNTSLRI